MIPKLQISETTIKIGKQPTLGETKPTISVSEGQYEMDSVIWNPQGDEFEAGIPSVTIKIKPDSKYTLDGLSSNSFTVEYATKTEYKRDGELGVITATFPEIIEPTPDTED